MSKEVNEERTPRTVADVKEKYKAHRMPRMQKKRVFLPGYRRSVTRNWRSAYEQYACAHHEAADEEEIYCFP